MKKNIIYSGIVVVVEVLVLAQCTRAEASPSTPAEPALTAPATSILTPTQQPALQETSTPQQTEPVPTPTNIFSQLTQQWRVAYFEEKYQQICIMDGEIHTSCLDLNEDNFTVDYEAPQFLALSPDGAKVVYGTECTMYVWIIGGDVFSLRKDSVCGSFREPEWSPDGNSIAYISEELYRGCPNCQSYFGDIFISSLDGTIHRVLTKDLDGWSHWPDWSPDGKHIVFSLERLRDENEAGYAANEDIVVIPAEGGSVVTLTDHAAGDTRPQWSPDGRQIAFLSNRANEEMMDLYLVDTGGGDVRMAAELNSPNYWPYSSAYFSWLPDGIHMIHGDRLIDTTTGQKELVSLPFGDSQGPWAMSTKTELISSEPNPTPESTVSPGEPNCASGWSRLRPDLHAVVAGGPNDDPNRVRETPDTGAAIVHQLYPGDIVRVVEGPVCVHGIVFWKVENSLIPGGTGWTAEGDGQEYFLEPIQ